MQKTTQLLERIEQSMGGEEQHSAEEQMKATSLWIDEQRKVASFHAMEPGVRVDFATDSFFTAFIDGLIVNHYRFQ
jgi:hypothetical protein